jgi:hypothetical protein
MAYHLHYIFKYITLLSIDSSYNLYITVSGNPRILYILYPNIDSMSEPVAQSLPGFTQLELLGSYGPVYRMVSNNPPRECHPDEIPVLDVSGMFGNLAARMKVADQIREAAMGTGFFYIKNHGISEELIAKAQAQAMR